MLKTTLPFEQKARASGRGTRPLFFLVFVNAHCERIWAEIQPTEEMINLAQAPLCDGSWTADGSETMGGQERGVLEVAGRLLGLSPFREGSAPGAGNLSRERGSAQISSLWARLSNTKGGDGVRLFSKIFAQENILGASAELKAWFPGTGSADALSLKKFRVHFLDLGRDEIEIEGRAL